MPRIPARLVASVVGLSLLASTAHAQFGGVVPRQKLFVFGIGGGVAVPVSNARDAFKNGFNGLAYVRVQPPVLPVSFGVNVTFQRFDLADAEVTVGGVTTAQSSGTGELLAGLGDIKYDLWPGPIHPYLIAGLGAYNLKTDPSGAAASSQSETRFGINGGAGLALRFGRISGYIQGRVDNVYTSDTGAIDTKSIRVIPVTLGIEF